MRDSQRLELTPTEYRDAQQAERQQTRVQLLEQLDRARRRKEPWYVWILNGCPRLTPEEYAGQDGKHAGDTAKGSRGQKRLS